MELYLKWTGLCKTGTFELKPHPIPILNQTKIELFAEFTNDYRDECYSVQNDSYFTKIKTKWQINKLINFYNTKITVIRQQNGRYLKKSPEWQFFNKKYRSFWLKNSKNGRFVLYLKTVWSIHQLGDCNQFQEIAKF